MSHDALAVLNCCAPVATTKPSIRRARAEDIASVTALLNNAQLPVEGVSDYFESGYAVAEQNGRMIGVAGLEIYGDVGLLRSVAVDDAFRGHGIGQALVNDRLQFARARNLSAVYLLTTTAAPFFKRLGFSEAIRADAPAELQQAPEFAYICGSTATTMRLLLTEGEDVRAVVRARYASAARTASAGESCTCCGDGKTKSWDPVTSNLYDDAQTSELPSTALLASLGCGNPTALAELKQGQVVLDLGSGGGIDVLLSAKRVGPSGKAYGLDMTDEMLTLARENQQKAGVTNVEFLKGEIENIPLPDNSVDVIISNCVINLSADKQRVINEAYRVLKPAGRFAVSDIVVRGEMPDPVRKSMELWTGCLAGALEEQEYMGFLQTAGFENVSVEPTRIYQRDDVLGLAAGAGLQLSEADVAQLEGKFMSAFVRAHKTA